MTEADLIKALRDAPKGFIRSDYDNEIEALMSQAADALSRYQWRDISGFNYSVNSMGVGERMLFLVPPYGASTGHFDGEKICLHSVLNKEAAPSHYMPLPTPHKEKE